MDLYPSVTVQIITVHTKYFKACSNFHLLYRLPFPLNYVLSCQFLSLILLPLVLLSKLFPPCFPQYQPISLHPSPLTLPPALSPSHRLRRFRPRCQASTPHQSHFRIYSFPPAKDSSISHRSTPAFNPSHPVAAMVNSISHRALVHPHPTPATSIGALIHLRE